MAFSLSNFGDFFRSLSPSIKKKDILIDLAHVLEELQQTILPMYDTSSKLTFKSKTLDFTNARFKSTSSGIKKYNGNSLKTITEVINTILKNQDLITETISKEFLDENIKTISDYYKLNLIKYVEGLSEFSDYARQWINSVVYESLQNSIPTSGNMPNMLIDSPVIRRDIELVNNEDNIVAFITISNLLNIPFTVYLDSIKNLKGHIYSDGDWGKGGSVLNSKLDPYKLGFVNVNYNPFYKMGTFLNTYRVKRHERNKAEFTRLQLMIYAFEKEKSVSTDPNKIESLEKQINYYSNLSNKLDGEIKRLESEV